MSNKTGRVMDVKIVVETKGQMRKLMDQLLDSYPQSIFPEHRRGQFRLVVALPARVEMVENKSTHDPIYVTTCDISAEGSGFLSPRELKLRQKVMLNIETDIGEIEIFATVIHCTGTVGMNKVGVKFDLIEPEAN
jgi:c-di-GMP-binding flagellar brake protein YcgR